MRQTILTSSQSVCGKEKREQNEPNKRVSGATIKDRKKIYKQKMDVLRSLTKDNKYKKKKTCTKKVMDSEVIKAINDHKFVIEKYAKSFLSDMDGTLFFLNKV